MVCNFNDFVHEIPPPKEFDVEEFKATLFAAIVLLIPQTETQALRTHII